VQDDSAPLCPCVDAAVARAECVDLAATAADSSALVTDAQRCRLDPAKAERTLITVSLPGVLLLLLSGLGAYAKTNTRLGTARQICYQSPVHILFSQSFPLLSASSLLSTVVKVALATKCCG